jgi:hypothetical protein
VGRSGPRWACCTASGNGLCHPDGAMTIQWHLNVTSVALHGLRLAALALILLIVPPRANAMAAVKRDFPQLVARAEQIVVGTVTNIGHETDPSGAPWTLVTFSDLQALKGEAGPTLTLRFYGGPAGGVAVHIPDMPTFAVGERDVLFVAGNGHDVCPLVGLWQGRFRVRVDAARRTEVVDDGRGNAVTGLAGTELVRSPLSDRAAAPALTLAEFRQLVADELTYPTTTGQGQQ